MGKRVCRKCGKIIPCRIIVDGKQKSLQNRKFCLKCSPYKNHNTRSDDPSKKPRGKYYGEYTEDEKNNIKICLYYKGLKRKEELIKKSGGGCERCGYNKSRNALCFHHRNPEEKKFGLALNNLWAKKWDVILEEWAKCDLVCANCHKEIEGSLRKENGLVEKVNKKYGTSF